MFHDPTRHSARLLMQPTARSTPLSTSWSCAPCCRSRCRCCKGPPCVCCNVCCRRPATTTACCCLAAAASQGFLQDCIQATTGTGAAQVDLVQHLAAATAAQTTPQQPPPSDFAVSQSRLRQQDTHVQLLPLTAQPWPTRRCSHTTMLGQLQCGYGAAHTSQTSAECHVCRSHTHLLERVLRLQAAVQEG